MWWWATRRTSSGTSQGAAAANSGVQFTVVGRGGLFTAADLRAAFKPPGHIIFPPTTLVAVENTHNRGGGVVFPQEDAVAICAAARELGVATYLDGARLFNTAVATGRSLCRAGGAVRRGVGRAVEGTWLPGGQRDRRTRRPTWCGRCGRGGCSAARCASPAFLPRPGLYALDHNIARLAEDHANARIMADRLADTRVEIDLATVQSNIVIFRVPEPLPDAATVVRRAQEQGVLVSAFAARTVRAVTHLNVDAAQCRHAADVLAKASRSSS